MTRSDLIDGVLATGAAALMFFAMAVATPAHAGTTTLKSPGATLFSPRDTVSKIDLSYDSDGKVTAHFTVDRGAVNARFSARFANPSAAYNYAAQQNAQAGGYEIGSYGSGIEVTYSDSNLKNLPAGVDGIIHAHRTNGIGWFRDSTQVIRTPTHGDDWDNQASMVSEKSAKSPAKSNGGGFFK